MIRVVHFFEKVNKGKLKMVNINYQIKARSRHIVMLITS